MFIKKSTSVNLKGFAAVSIILHHLYSQGCIVGDGWIVKLLENFGACNVVLFYTLSGYGMYMASTGGKQSINQLIKIYIPYLFVTSIWAVYWYANSCTAGSLGKIFLIFVGVVTDYNWEVDRTMWYMTFLFFWYLIFGCLWLLKNINVKIKILILFAVASYLHISWGTFAPSLSMLIRQSAYGFPCGVLLAYIAVNCGKTITILNKRIVQFLLAGVCLSLFFVMYFKLQFNDNIYVISSFLYAMALIFLFNFIASFYEIKMLNFIGQNSYMIYLLHMKIILVMQKHVVSWNVIAIIFTIISIIIAGWITNKVLKRITSD